MRYNPQKPYNSLPLLPPNVEIENTVILKKKISASRALSELKGAIINLPNPTLFIDTINLQETQASSAIENIITTQDELFKSTVAEKINNNYSNSSEHKIIMYGFLVMKQLKEDINKFRKKNVNLIVVSNS
ncbi:MAG: Fic/DOC family N-terminal domain-containing protein [Melioribacteraceae bacterium]